MPVDICKRHGKLRDTIVNNRGFRYVGCKDCLTDPKPAKKAAADDQPAFKPAKKKAGKRTKDDQPAVKPPVVKPDTVPVRRSFGERLGFIRK